MRDEKRIEATHVCTKCKLKGHFNAVCQKHRVTVKQQNIGTAKSKSNGRAAVMSEGVGDRQHNVSTIIGETNIKSGDSFGYFFNICGLHRFCTSTPHLGPVW